MIVIKKLTVSILLVIMNAIVDMDMSLLPWVKDSFQNKSTF